MIKKRKQEKTIQLKGENNKHEKQLIAVKEHNEKFKENYRLNPYETMREYLLKYLLPNETIFLGSHPANDDILEKLIKLEAAFHKGQ